MEHALELLPIGDICFLKDCLGGGLGGAGMAGYKLLGFGAKGKVSEDDITAFAEEEVSKREVYAWGFGKFCGRERVIG